MSKQILRPAGYRFLIDHFELNVIDNWHNSYISTGSQRKTTQNPNEVQDLYPKSYWPGDGVCDHLEFALKYDGVNLAILAAVFTEIDSNELTTWVRSTPQGKYVRRIWFLYELITEKRLEVDDLSSGNYVALLEADKYICHPQPETIRRQRIQNNLLGTRRFSPTVRRSATIDELGNYDLKTECERALSGIDSEIITRTFSYLYTRETRSSFGIENIDPSPSRVNKFVALLGRAEQQDFVTKQALVEAHASIVEPRFSEDGYRLSQNYVGELRGFTEQYVHYVSPKPQDVADLMAGLIETHNKLKAPAPPASMSNPKGLGDEAEAGQTAAALIHAAVISFGFVFIHPFEDGNGRLHRFLIHNILAQREASPKGVIFPVSAAMLNNRELYDACLETFSLPLLECVDYELSPDGAMTVSGDTTNFYRYIDMTTQVEALFGFVKSALENDIVIQAQFLENYDTAKESLLRVVELPDRQIDLIIKFCTQNNGRLSKRKRRSHFSALSDAEIEGCEIAVRSAFGANI